MSASTTTAPKPSHLEENFAPVQEEITATELEVTGTLPRELAGLYLRNGPNPRTGSSPHWFFGTGMVHGVRLESGQARWYRNRYVRSASFEGRGREAGIRGGGSSNTNVMAHAGRIFSFVEAAMPIELSQELDTLGTCDFEGGVTTAFTAHGKICPRTGELVAFGYQFAHPHLTLYRIDRAGRVVERRAIEVGGPSYLHDFAITERYAVFFDTPLRMVADWGGGVLPFEWRRGQATRIAVVPRDGGEVRWFSVAPCLLAHTVNAFERDGRIVIDGTRSEDPRTPTRLHRWEVDLAAGTAIDAPFEPRCVELPRIDERRIGHSYRHAYVVELPSFGAPAWLRGSRLRRYDVESGASVATTFGERYEVAEAVFAPNSSPGHAAEDDGWLLAFRYDRARDGSDLVVLDPRDLAADPVAIVALPQRVPMGIHGSWVADAPAPPAI
jgi:carotenoid cleavage dioxygenase-like enzyme